MKTNRNGLALITLLFIIALMQSGISNAQNYNTQIYNPFSLSSVQYNSAPVFVDLDGDGDLDMMSGCNNGSFYYFKNIGTSSSPSFESQKYNPFSLSNVQYNSSPAFVDLDGDGDLDMMSGCNNGSFYYFKNIGTSSSPSFESQKYNPFSLSSVQYNSAPAFVDLDGDGDLDMMSGCNNGSFYYFKNSSSTGIFEVSKENLTVAIYPNPTNGVIRLELSVPQIKSNNYNVRIRNVIGKTIFHLTKFNLQSTIDISDKLNGIYFVEIYDGKEIYTGKIIKK